MRTFEGKSHYDILKVPLNAGSSDLKRAYKDALGLYEENSLVTYALFSDDQRTDLLQAIDEAYHTLADPDKRSAYNQMLIDSGQIDASLFAGQKEQPNSSSDHQAAGVKHRDIGNWVKKKSEASEIKKIAQEIMGKDMVSGIDLKKLREAIGIEIDEIFNITRISKTTLSMIEGNEYENLPAEVFLKSFIKSYSEILHLDPHRVVNGYLKHMRLSMQPEKSR